MNDAPIAAPLELHHTRVQPDWLDYNGHMNEACYLVVFSHATDDFMDFIGLDAAAREATGHTIYTAETHITYLREVSAGEPLVVVTQLLAMDPKRAHIFHSMLHGESRELLATAEKMLLNVDLAGPKVTPFAANVLSRLQAIEQVHEQLPTPRQAGARIALRRG